MCMYLCKMLPLYGGFAKPLKAPRGVVIPPMHESLAKLPSWNIHKAIPVSLGINQKVHGYVCICVQST